MDELDQPISWDYINKSTTNYVKSPGLNDVPSNAFKALDDANLSWILLFYNQFWHNQADFDECYEGQVVHVPKKGDTTDPNKWIGFTLMDSGNNIYSSIICGQLFKIIRKNGIKCQFVYTPGVGCQDGTFKINTLLHLIHNQNLAMWLAFADLVKAFDTSNHALLIAILRKYGAPPILCSAIKRMYNKIRVKLIIGKLDTPIDFKLGFKQGDSMYPVLFLFLMMAFAETLEDEWTALGLSKSQFSRKDNSPMPTRKLVNHRPGTFLSGMLFEIFYMLYVDGGAFVFESRTNIKKGITLLSDHFARFGLKMHIGTEKKTLKTECVFSPPPGFFNTRTLPLTYPTNSTLYPQKKERYKKRRTREEKEYTKCR